MDVSEVKALMAEIAPVIREFCEAQIAPLRAEVAELRARETPPPERGEQGPQGEPGPAGEVDMEAVKALVAAAVAEVPPAERGEKGEAGKDGLPGENGADGAPGADGEPGKDGLGLADALIDRDGALVLTMTDGTTKSLGKVVGRDGQDGKDGAPGHTFTLDDFEIVPMDERTIKMGFTYGEIMHSFELALPIVIYRGLWREGETYQRGDMVTWAGSVWHCDTDDCQTKPDVGGYTLAVKRGSPGRDAR